MTRLLATTALLISALALPACVTNPATGDRQLNFLSQAEEVAIGQRATGEIVNAYGGEIDDAAIQNYVSSVGNRIAANVEPEYRDLPWEFIALNSEQINAFALPGGKIFITRGLLERMNTEAQLAGVLGHEAAHVTAEHHDLAIQRQYALAGLAAAGQVAGQTMDDDRIAIATSALVTAGGVFSLRYDREHEYEADNIGVRYMARAGYNPRGQLELMQILESLSGSAAQPEWLSTHPDSAKRVDRLEQLINSEYQRAAADPSFIIGEESYRDAVLSRLR